MLYVKYLLLALVVIYAAAQASKLVNELDKKTKVGGAVIGGLLLAAITSLPELITSISASMIYDKPGLAFGNILGSNFFNMVIIGIADLYFIKALFLNKVTKNSKTIGFAILMYTLMLIPFIIPAISGASFIIPVSIISILILFIYFANVKSLLASEAEVSNEKSNYTLKQIALQFMFWAVVLVIASILITGVTSDIADQLKLQTSFAGALFLGIATSLPELTAVITLVRLKNYNAAIANAVGSNVLNFAILGFVDVIYIKENLYSLVSKNKALLDNIILLLLLGLFNSIILLVALNRKATKNKIIYILPSVLLIGAYVTYLLLSI